MCKVIAITNQKGGCAKTNVTVNLGIGLAREGKKVALIDNDAQGSLTASLGYEEPDELNVTLANIMMNVINDEENEPEYGFLHHEEGVSFIPANVELSGLEISLINVISRETILRSYIETIRDQYDYILIDCAPSLGMLTINALVAADAVIIPVPAAYLPVKGLVQLLKTISMVKRRLNRKLQNCMRHMIPPLEFLRHIFHCLSGRQSAVQKESVSINMIQMEMQQMLIID